MSHTLLVNPSCHNLSIRIDDPKVVASILGYKSAFAVASGLADPKADKLVLRETCQTCLKSLKSTKIDPHLALTGSIRSPPSRIVCASPEELMIHDQLLRSEDVGHAGG